MAKAPTDIKSLARAHTETCIRALAGIVRQAKAPESARVQAAVALLDRGWGKPSQAVDMTVEDKRDRAGVADYLANLLAAQGGQPVHGDSDDTSTDTGSKLTH